MPATVRDTGGVGIILSDAFVKRVAGDTGSVKWAPRIIPGRAGRLTLSGPEGNLDLYVAYLQSGETAEDR